MEVAVDAVLRVIEPRCHRLANAAGIVTVAMTTRESRDQCGFEQALRIDNLIILVLAQRAKRACHLLPGRGRKCRRAPTAPGNRDDLVDCRMQTKERCK